MKATRILLLVIGLLGLGASIVAIFQGRPILDQVLTIICSAALLYGYYYYGKEENQPKKKGDDPDIGND